MISDDYQIISLDPIKSPPNLEGGEWHCYVIAQGTNTIRGYRQGSLPIVTQAVEQLVRQLNERRIGNRGRVHLVMPRSASSDAAKRAAAKPAK
jgi:hypothetical protein